MKSAIAGLWIFVSLFTQITVAAPQWIAHASIPGPDVPPQGISRFDQLFMQQDGTYAIPFPFTELIAALERKIDNGQQSSVRQVFVPLGRSLQRDTPAPDHFKFPRSVLAVNGEMRTSDNEAGLVMQYRLFMAHQPITETLEVISYNDKAGRFEFQIVENYRLNQQPLVRQANRTMCLSCHQNAAAIFPRVPWSETSSNVAIANQLIKNLPQQYDSLIGVITNDAGFIDVLAERANYLSAAQRIWQQGCDSLNCRLAILRAAFQYRLSAKASFDSTDTRYRKYYLGELQQGWQSKWPQGLALANSRIDNFDPLQKQLTLQQDPLMARPAHAVWYRADPILARGIVYRLAGFFTLDDIRRIDRHLIMTQAEPIATRKYHAKCFIESNDIRSRVLYCGDKADIASLRARLEFETVGAKISSARVLQLQFPGDANIWQPEISGVVEQAGRFRLVIGNNEDGLSARLSNGDRIREMNLNFGLSGNKNLEIVISTESIQLDQMLAGIFNNNQQELSDSLSSQPLRRQAVITDLSRQAGFKSLKWIDLPQPAVSRKPASSFELPGSQALLQPYCAGCHSDNSRNPPGFLAGSRPDLKIRQCAPRILARLKAWQPEREFSKSPMPPPASLVISVSNANEWPNSDHYRALVSAIELLLERDFSQTRYDDLPPCQVES